jgi:hypothetical protein
MSGRSPEIMDRALTALSILLPDVTIYYSSTAMFPEPTMEGLDQLNVRLSRALMGKGDALVQVNIEGNLANVVEIKIK